MVRILAVAANSPDPEQSLKAKYQYTSKILVLKNKLIPIFRSWVSCFRNVFQLGAVLFMYKSASFLTPLVDSLRALTYKYQGQDSKKGLGFALQLTPHYSASFCPSKKSITYHRKHVLRGIEHLSCSKDLCLSEQK